MLTLLGLGREVRELLAALARGGEGPGQVRVLDEAPAPTLPDGLGGLEVTVERVDLDDPEALADVAGDLLRSPGISPYRPALAAARDRGLAMTTPTGWWLSRHETSNVIAVTGTKGKSTTAALVAHLLRAQGRDVELCGNIGRAAVALDAPETADDVVLELSSYQLADLPARVALAGLTVLAVDHVPWHGSVERYHADKLRLLALADRRIATPAAAEHPSVGGEVDGVACPPDRARLRDALAAVGLLGEHLVDDAALAMALVDARLARPGGLAGLADALHGFEPLPHRLTPVGEVDGVRFVDDSISTVPESALAAAASHRPRGPVTLLLGGDDRGQRLEGLVARLTEDEQLRAVLLPPLGDRLADELGSAAAGRVRRAADLEQAVAIALAFTPAGGAVVLSPAAPSFSAYRDFVERGEHFASLVADLASAGGR